MTRPLVLIPSEEREEDLRQVALVLGDSAEVAMLPPDGGASRRALLERAEALLVFAWRLREDELDALRNVRVVQSVWSGVDRIPVAALRAAFPALRIASGAGPNAAQVAEHALGLYLDCARRISRRDRALRQGEWQQHETALRVAGSRVAVVGYGHVGRRVARALRALDADVLIVNRSGQDEDGLSACDLDGLKERLGALDGVILALPLTAATEGMVDRHWLESMPSDGILVNVGRGRLVVEDDLYTHLEAHPDFFAGLDVWWHYPKKGSTFRQRHPFEALENVVMTPHSAFQVEGAREEMVQGAAANLRAFLDSGRLENEWREEGGRERV